MATNNSPHSFSPRCVFLCHSSGDKQAIPILHQRLKGDGFRPWLDQADILPGAEWDTAIRRALRASDFVLVCISSSSINKSGYLQKEIKFALDIAEEKPEGSVFIIPARLEACEIPERLSRWQRVDLFEANGYERLVAALGAQAKPHLLDGFLKTPTQANTHLLEGFLETRGKLRSQFGVSFMEQASEEDSSVTPDNAESIVAEAILGLSSKMQIERVRTALLLTNRCFRAKGKLSFLSQNQQLRLTGALSLALAHDEATQCAVMWALLWLTGARDRAQRAALVHTHYVLLNQSLIGRIDKLIQSPGLDSNTLKYGCLVLTRELGLNPVINQIDWIYQLARVADGAIPRRDLPRPLPVGRQLPTSWMKDLLSSNIDLEVQFRIAQTLGALGVFVAEMREPLRLLFSNAAHALDDRDEALLYLALSGSPSAARILIQAADTPPTEKDDYFYTRGMFGLILLDDVDVLLAQLQKDLAHADPDPYAYALAGSNDPRGRNYLELLRKNGTPRNRAAAAKALATVWP